MEHLIDALPCMLWFILIAAAVIIFSRIVVLPIVLKLMYLSEKQKERKHEKDIFDNSKKSPPSQAQPDSRQKLMSDILNLLEKDYNKNEKSVDKADKLFEIYKQLNPKF